MRRVDLGRRRDAGDLWVFHLGHTESAIKMVSRGMGSLLLLQDGEPKTRFTLSGDIVIGRSSECEIQVMDPGLSRKHARIREREGAYRIEDLGSHNGTFVAGDPVRDERRLADGDDIQLGTVRFIFNPSLEVLYDRGSGRTVCLLDEPGEAAPAVERLQKGFRLPDAAALLDIFDITCDVAATLDVGRLLPALLDRLMAHFSADRGFILTREPSGALIPRAVVSDRGTAAVSRSLVERAFASRGPLLFHNALENVSFVGSRSVVEHRLRSVMLTPLFSGDRPIGVVQLDSHAPEAFTQETLARLALLAKPAALSIGNALKYENEVRKNAVGGRRRGGPEIVTRDAAMTALLETAERAAASPARVLVTGESGTGKELVARMIHDRSPRADRPFVAINCGAILETVLESELFGHEKGAFTGAVKKHKGCFELADGGTLFLDEVAELAPSTQVKLLRALQEGTFTPVGGERPVSVDVRVIAATNQNLRQLVDEKRFREDLYFRLNVIHLEIPPLRARGEDVSSLMRFFLERFARSMSRPVPGLSPQAEKALRRYPWPGNVRELQNAAERLVVLFGGGEIQAADLPAEVAAPEPGALPASQGTLKDALARTELELIARALRETRGKKAAACRLLGISRPTLDKKIVEYNIEWMS